jgi:hypothetical protein
MLISLAWWCSQGEQNVKADKVEGGVSGLAESVDVEAPVGKSEGESRSSVPNRVAVVVMCLLLSSGKQKVALGVAGEVARRLPLSCAVFDIVPSPCETTSREDDEEEAVGLIEESMIACSSARGPGC